MKVILIPASVELVGVSTHVFNLATLLHQHGMLDLVLCPAAGWLPSRLQQQQIPHAIVSLSYRPAAFLPSSVTLVRFLHSRRAADVVHLHGRFPLLLSALALVACSRLRFVATVHQFTDADRTARSRWRSTLETLLLRRMARLCCVSRDLKRDVLSRIGAEASPPVDVIPNWIEPLWHANGGRHRTRPVRTGRPGLRLCAIGRLSPEKGFDVLVRALAILQRDGPETHCDIFGDGPQESALLTMARAAGIAERVQIRRPAEDVRCVLPSYDVLVIPSRSESFGIVALEAYDASVPVIASDVPGLRDTVVNGRTGLLFESGNAQSLADAIRILARSPALAQELVANAMAHLEQHLPNQRLIAQYQEFYDKALHTRGA